MYASLHNHSEYSVLDGYAHPEEYLKRTKELDIPVFAITEHGNQYSWVYFDKLAAEYPELKIIYGVELYECFDVQVRDPEHKYFHLVALAKDEQGRIALNRLVTESNFECFYHKPRVDLSMLKPYAEHLVILSACLASKLAREANEGKCVDYIKEYKTVFPYFYLEMQSHATADQAAYNRKILRLAEITQTPFVITTDSHAATKEDLNYQGRHVQIARDKDTMDETYSGCYLQSEDEIHQIMDEQIGADHVDLGLANTLLISELIEEVHMPFQPPQLPTFPLPEGYKDNFSYLKQLTQLGWSARDFHSKTEQEQKIRMERLEYELSIIHQMRYDGYFLIVWDFIRYARDNGIIVGDGRGSGGGSIVNYLIGITELDPVEHDLIFERFLNPERVSMPDIDIDFADRDKIIAYLMNKYGEERVCQIINFSYITPIVAIKDAGRVLGVPYLTCEKISKRFTADSFEDCINADPAIIENFAEYGELLDIAGHLSGRVRNASIHAGGVGIVDTSITDYMGMKAGSKGERVISVDKRMIEEIGIIKFDILGVSTLAVVQNTMKTAKIPRYEISAANSDFLNDKKMFELLQSGKTNGVFQVESQGMKDLLIRLKPETLEDVTAVLALYRPDTMGMLEDYIYYRHHADEIKYWHPDMKPILRKTYGCIIYQEQIMDIVRIFGGRTYGGADKFRKGIGKKDKELVRAEAEKLREEIIQNGYEEELAETISAYLAKMGGYSFNKSHAALYALLTLKTAYLKAHYTADFFCALLDQNRSDYGMINKYIMEAREFQIEILPPHINRSDRGFIVNEGKIIFALEAVRGIGTKCVDKILCERAEWKFNNFIDFLDRVEPTEAQAVALIKCGAIPCKSKLEFLEEYAKMKFEYKPYSPVKSIPKLSVLREKYGIDIDKIKDKKIRLMLYNRAKKEEYEKQATERFIKYMENFREKYLQDEQFWEFEALSVFLDRNPFVEAYQYISRTCEQVEDGGDGVMVGVISNVIKKKDRYKKQYAFVSLYSAFGLYELVCWSGQYQRYQQLIQRGKQVALIYKKDNEKLSITEMKPYRQWLEDKKIGGALSSKA